MGEIDFVLILLYLFAVVIAIIGLIVIIRNRQKAKSSLLYEVYKKIGEKKIGEAEQKANTVFKEKERAKNEISHHQPEEESAIVVEVSGEIEEEHQQIEYEKLCKADQAKEKANGGYCKSKELQKIEKGFSPVERPQSKAKEKNKHEEKTSDKRLEPEKRGGRPRSLTEEQERQTPQKFNPHHLKPEIICWKKNRQWIIGVEVPEEILDCPNLTVEQNGLLLERDQSINACWRLEQAHGTVVVSWFEDKNGQNIEIALDQEGYLLFKLSGQKQNKGRRVLSPSLGWHLVITPEDWNRDEALSGSPSVAPELVDFDGFRAHFFVSERNEDSKIAFLTPKGKSIIIMSSSSKFELIGTRLNDENQNVGPLFGQKPPKIYSLVDEIWKDVGTIVVGEEGEGNGRWRKALYPIPGNKEQDLPLEITSGWYFIRFYDTNDDLIESLDFRLVIPLQDIRIVQSSPFPSYDGHESAHIELQHEPNCIIQPANNISKEIQIEKRGERTILTIPPVYIYDETCWLIGSERERQVQATFLVERIWWIIDIEENSPTEWRDDLLSLERDDFNATSNRGLWIRFPRMRWTNVVLVGFKRRKARSYRVKKNEREIFIPLREFGDCQELNEQDSDHFLTIWIDQDNQYMEGSVAILPATIGSILCIGWGRKKRATAVAVLREGKGVIKVNGRVIDDYFAISPMRARQFLQRIIELPETRQLLNNMEVSIEVRGSSPSTNQQAKSSAHALARALMKYDHNLIQLLQRAGFGGVKVTEKFGI